ncbi:MAG: phosphatidate cytidylyltransferase [Chitinispirillales bacterium]|jgi:phosphatidate cytidylyltransferase|nr:phosphatidate cytidylyltransferase [Chitinispirillales bacterium]
MINRANLKKRLAFAGAAIPVAFVIISSRLSISALALRLLGMPAGTVPNIYPGQILALAIVLLGTYEYMKMLSAANRVNAFWLGYVWIFLTSAADLLGHTPPNTLSNGALLVIAAFEAFFFGRDAQFGRWKRMSLFFCGTVFLGIAASSLTDLYRAPIQSLFNNELIFLKGPGYRSFGYLDVVAIITATFMCDSAAYFVGSTLGKHHFSAISPNKTIEGSVAGLIAATAVMSVAWIFIRNPKYPIILGPAIGVLIGVTAQAGDLLASLIKRYFHVKDASHIIPGHGGILDRFDSLFFTAPVLYLFAWLFVRWAA